MPKAIMYVLGRFDKSEFIGWSCGQFGSLADAAIYRSSKNAQAKANQLRKLNANWGGETYQDLTIYPLNVSID